MAETTALLRRAPWTALPASGGWTWRGTALLTVVLLHPYLLVLTVGGSDGHRLHVAGTMSLLLVQLAILASAVALAYEWRISRRPATGWLAMMLAFMAAQHVPFALLAVQGASQGRYGYVMGVTQLPSALAVLTLAVLAARDARLPAGNPLTTGLVLGGLAAVGRIALINAGVDPTLRLTEATGFTVLALVALVVTAAVVVLARSRTIPEWARARLVVFVASVAVARGLSTGHGHDIPTPLSVAVAALGAAALGAMAAALLRQAIHDNAHRLVELAHRAATAEVSVRHGQEQLHELHATVAGVAQASRLLIQPGAPTGAKRARLESLLDSEMSRLERMLTRRGQESVEDLCVDEVLLPLVETQRTLGTVVQFAPSGLRAVGRADDVAEAMHILLSNAARHAPNAAVTVATTRRGNTIEIRVSDDGPGVPTALRSSLFEWGTRSSNSPGQGIGLQLARRLMVAQSGNLQLESEGRAGGATFVLSIPASPPGLS